MKKILLILFMFLFITNVKAMTFNLELTNIEAKGNNNTTGEISNIDLENMSMDITFHNVLDEVSFEITLTNTGDKAGTLNSIIPTGGNSKILYTTNIPNEGLPIEANGSNKILVTAKLLEESDNGNTSSEFRISYNYEEGTCPTGEILSEDETSCSCREGLERNNEGVCDEPSNNENPGENDEPGTIVNPDEPGDITDNPGTSNNTNTNTNTNTNINTDVSTKTNNITNPKTLDNVILITLLFIVSGLGIYAVLFTKLNNDKKKIIVGVAIGIITMSTSITVLIKTFGFENLVTLINSVTKESTITLTINESIDISEPCTIENELCPKYLVYTEFDYDEDRYINYWTLNKDDLKELQQDKTQLPGVYIKKEAGIVSVCFTHDSGEQCIPHNYNSSLVYDLCDEFGSEAEDVGSGESISCSNREYYESGDYDDFKYEFELGNNDPENGIDYSYIEVESINSAGEFASCSFNINNSIIEDNNLDAHCSYESYDFVNQD